MGNGQNKLTNADARDMLGAEKWTSYRKQLEKYNDKFIDYEIFNLMIRSRFDCVPKVLVEVLYKVIAQDINRKLFIDDFLIGLAILFSSDKQYRSKVIWKIYDINDSGKWTRKNIETFLLYAYENNEPYKPAEIKRFLDNIFIRQSEYVTSKQWEDYHGNTEILTKWIEVITNALLAPLSPLIARTELKYSAVLEESEIIKKYNININVLEQIKMTFTRLCDVGPRPEMDLLTWLDITKSCLSPALANCIFCSKIKTLKLVWRTTEFLEFCAVFGSTSIEQKIEYLIEVFQIESQRLSSNSSDQRLQLLKSTYHNLRVTHMGRSSTSLNNNTKDTSVVNKYHMKRMIKLLTHDLKSLTSYTNSSQHSTSNYLDMRGSFTAIATSPRSNAADMIEAPLSNPSRGIFQSRHMKVNSMGHNSSMGGPRRASALYSPVGSSRFKSIRSGKDSSNSNSSMVFDNISVTSVESPANGLNSPPQQDTTGLPYEWDPLLYVPIIDNEIATDLSVIDEESEQMIGIDRYKMILSLYESKLIGIHDCEVMACCLFGYKPSTPMKEKELIKTLIKRQTEALSESSNNTTTTAFTSSKPFSSATNNSSGAAGAASTRHTYIYGVVGTEWCIISKIWYDNWKSTVNYQDSKNTYTPDMNNTTTNGVKKKGMGGKKAENESLFPGPLDNTLLLQKSEAGPLVPNCSIGNNIEVLFPSVFDALLSWYGGGPRIIRRVIMIDENTQKTDIELYPLHLRIATCDYKGKTQDIMTERLYSKQLYIRDILLDLCEQYNLDPLHIKLWNYGSSVLTEQYVLPTEVTLSKARLKEGQWLLLEMMLEDGSWPRTSLQPVSSSSAALNSTRHDSNAGSQLGPDVKRNDGKVGLENIGNTCYMNSSLQALVHTEPLTEYFLRNYYTNDINTTSKFGYQGKLAKAYSKLVRDIWTTSKTAINPKNFHSEFTSLAKQFRGYSQHDAQEFMSFLLDGLSEDLNVVSQKPYIEHPDSDDRPDSVLADIWWENHKKRENSVMQALFTGQFKSVTTCGCGQYTSARFEPFQFLTLPVPEDHEQVVNVYIVSMYTTYGAVCSVRVHKEKTLYEVIQKILTLQIPYIDNKHDYLMAMVTDSLVINIFPLEKKINTLKDTDNVFMFQLPKVPLESIPESSSSSTTTGRTTSPRITTTSGANSPSTPSRTPTLQSSPVSQDRQVVGVNPIAHWNQMLRVTTKGECYKRIVLIQRRPQLSDGGGLEIYRLEPFGLPFILQTSSSNMTLLDLYEAVAIRSRPYIIVDSNDYKAYSSTSIQDLTSIQNMNIYASLTPYDFHTAPNHRRMSLLNDISNPQKYSNRVSTHATSPKNTTTTTTATTTTTTTTTTSSSMSLNALSSIQYADTDILLGGEIPKYGFVLRTVRAGPGIGCGMVCSRCPWIKRCQGCVLPQHKGLKVIDVLADQEMISIDWHYVVNEEFIDISIASEIRKHPNFDIENDQLMKKVIPFKNCLDKFTEDEKIEGITCPRCKSDTLMKKSLKLWRGPPVLLIQLKRFQFDRHIRRKLVDKIDFPMDNFDISPYYATTKLTDKSTTTTTTTTATTSNGNSGSSGSMPASYSHEYDLYAIVHHVGRLGDGHYVSTVRCNTNWMNTSDKPATGFHTSTSMTDINRKLSVNTNTYNTTTTTTTGHNTSDGVKEWLCYNDTIVSTAEVEDIRCASTAYVLFYIRKDIRNKPIEDIRALYTQTATNMITLETPSTTTTTATTPPRNGKVIAKGGKTSPLNKTVPPGTRTKKMSTGGSPPKESHLSTSTSLHDTHILSSSDSYDMLDSDSPMGTSNSARMKLPKPRDRLQSTRDDSHSSRTASVSSGSARTMNLDPSNNHHMNDRKHSNNMTRSSTADSKDHRKKSNSSSAGSKPKEGSRGCSIA